MKTTEIIKGALPDGVTLTTEQIQALVKAVNDAVGAEFVPKESYSKKTEKLDGLERELAELKGKATDADTYKAKYEAEVKAHADTKAAQEAAKTAEAKQSAVIKQLIADGANEKVVKLLVKSIDLASVELDGETVKNWEDVSKACKAEFAELFQEAAIDGVKPATPPKPALSGSLTMEQIKAMTPDQINANWAEVQKTLQKGAIT